MLRMWYNIDSGRVALMGKYIPHKESYNMETNEYNELFEEAVEAVKEAQRDIMLDEWVEKLGETKTADDVVNVLYDYFVEEDDEWVKAVEELDDWNGVLDGSRCYDMCELDELFGDMSISDFLDRMDDYFSTRDEYFYVDDCGKICTTDYKEDVYNGYLERWIVGQLLDEFENVSRWYIGLFVTACAKVYALYQADENRGRACVACFLSMTDTEGSED